MSGSTLGAAAGRSGAALGLICGAVFTGAPCRSNDCGPPASPSSGWTTFPEDDPSDAFRLWAISSNFSKSRVDSA